MGLGERGVCICIVHMHGFCASVYIEDYTVDICTRLNVELLYISQLVFLLVYGLPSFFSDKCNCLWCPNVFE